MMKALAISQIPRFYLFLLMLMSGLRYSFMIGSAEKVVYILCVQGASAPPPRSGLIMNIPTYSFFRLLVEIEMIYSA